MGKFTPTIATSVEAHERIDADEYDLEAQEPVVKAVKIETKTCCESQSEPWEAQYDTSPAAYDTQRVLTALGMAFLLGTLVGTAVFFTISGNVVE